MLDLIAPTVFLVCTNALMAWALWYPMAGGQLSMGGIGTLAIGAYTAGFLTASGHTNFLVGMVAGAGVAALASVPLALIATRLDGFPFAIVTLGLTQSLQIVISNIDWLGGAQGLLGVTPSNDGYIAAPALLVVVALFSWLVWRSRVGRMIDVLRADPLQANALGIPVIALKFHVLIVAGLVAGATGAILVRWQGFVDPSQFGFTLLTELFAYVVVGGIASFWGPILGASTLTLLLQVLVIGGTSRQILFGSGLVIAILVRRDGVLTRSLRLQERRIGRLLEVARLSPSEPGGVTGSTSPGT